MLMLEFNIGARGWKVCVRGHSLCAGAFKKRTLLSLAPCFSWVTGKSGAPSTVSTVSSRFSALRSFLERTLAFARAGPGAGGKLVQANSPMLARFSLPPFLAVLHRFVVQATLNLIG